MKKLFCGISAAALMLCCFASCGSRAVSNEGVKVTAETFSKRTTEEIVEEITGKWETTIERLNDEDTVRIYKRYDFKKDGSGTYYDTDGNAHKVSWSVTPVGGMKLIYTDENKTEMYDFIGCDMVTVNDTSEGKRESHITKVGLFTIEID